MPNFCSNTLEFYCAAHQLMLMRESTQNGSREFDFNRVLPCPEELAMQPSPSMLDREAWEIKYGSPTRALTDRHELLEAARTGSGKWAAVPNVDQVADRLEQLRITCGAISESDWKVKHWGTESNALGGQEFRVGETASEPHSWWFQTRWSPPRLLIQALSRKFSLIPMRLISNEDLSGLAETTCFYDGQEVPATDLPVPETMRTWLTR
jgi:hypothetical protein